MSSALRACLVFVWGMGSMASGQQVAFYRIQGAEAELRGLSPEGLLACAVSEGEGSCRVQRMLPGGDWSDFSTVSVTAPVQVLRVFLPGIGAEEAFIPAGSFVMGATTNAGHEGYANELPQHRVETLGYLLDRTEVTRVLWAEVAAWSLTNGYDLDPAAPSETLRTHPVVNVSWESALKWCNARSEREGLAPCYWRDGVPLRIGTAEGVDWDRLAAGYRLPTEAEWEKAARGGIPDRRFPWAGDDEIKHARANYYSFEGYSYDTSPTRSFHPDCDPATPPLTRPVASFAANGYGLHDMAGNVWEWCWDGYSAAYYADSPASDPSGIEGSTTRSVRGGAWNSGADGVRAAVRCHMPAASVASCVGFRCARIAE